MPAYFCDGLKDVSVVNGVVRLEFQRLEPAPGGAQGEFRTVSELAVAMPLQGLAQAFGVLDALRERLVRDGVMQPAASSQTPPPTRAPDRSPNF